MIKHQFLKEGNRVTLLNPTTGKQSKVRILQLLDCNTRAVIQFYNGEIVVVSTTWLNK